MINEKGIVQTLEITIGLSQLHDGVTEKSVTLAGKTGINHDRINVLLQCATVNVNA